MNLSPMRYKSYVWEYNPRVYEVTYKRHIAALKIPRGGFVMQDMGKSFKVLSGEGEFTGEGAYEKFRELARVFEEGGSGALVHPVWQLTKAYFVSLALKQEPKENYVAYTFEFWEDISEKGGFEKVSETIVPGNVPSGTVIGSGGQSAKTYTVVKGDTLWAIAARHNTTVADLVSKNPQIRDPNLIHPGDVIKL